MCVTSLLFGPQANRFMAVKWVFMPASGGDSVGMAQRADKTNGWGTVRAKEELSDRLKENITGVGGGGLQPNT